MTDHADIPTFKVIDRTWPTIEANLAVDEAILIAAEERGAGPALRFWEAGETAVVLGASSRILEDVEVDRCRAEGVPIARRSSGGGTVVVGPGALNVAVVLPVDGAPGLGAVDVAQIYVLERTAEALRRLGPAVRVQGSGDLTLGDRKFAGSAQRRLRRYFLVHFSMIYDFPLETIARLTRQPRRQPAYRAGRGHHDFLTSLPLPRAAIVGAVRGAWGVPPDSQDDADVAEDLIGPLLESKFLAPGWASRL